MARCIVAPVALLACASLACARSSTVTSGSIRPEPDAAFVAAAAASAALSPASSPPPAATAVIDASAALDAGLDADASHVPTTTLTIAGRLDVDYPTSTFRVVRLVTSIFEDYMGGHFPFEIELRLVSRPVAEEARAAKYDPPIFGSSYESSFREDGGLAERRELPSGLHGYVVEMGVEGIGQVDTFVPVSAKETLHVICHYCCGLIAAPKLPREEQDRICDEVVASLRPR